MGEDLIIRAAADDDWPMLQASYRTQYRANHPLNDRSFWRWRFGDPDAGRSVIAVSSDRVVGHLGAAIQDGVAWIINVYVEPEFRGRGLLGKLYGTGRTYGALAATNVNRAGTDMYRRMGWYRYADLQRFVVWNPAVAKADLMSTALADLRWPAACGAHYWEQPGLRGLVAPDGSEVVDQLSLGGLRVITLHDPVALPDFAFPAGVRWLDYVTSWNDPLCRDLDRQGWVPDRNGPIPWLLSPLDPGSRAEVNVFSERPFDPARIIRRSESDHGRVGSIVGP